MKLTAYQSPLVYPNDDLWWVLKETLPLNLPEKSVMVVTSKIIGLCQDRVVKVPSDPVKARELKVKLMKQEAEWYTQGGHGIYLTIKHHHLMPSAGIDESNTGGYFVLWPENLQETANEIWRWLRKTYKVHEVGVIISDSRSMMMTRGVMGTALSHAGFVAVRDKIGSPDLFGKALEITMVNDMESLAVAAVHEMGESSERRPVAVIEEAQDIQFQDRVPTSEEIKNIGIEREDDLYGVVINAVEWEKGGGVNIL